ncbi:hypothetical protein HPB52_016280 [Rhipicephalus sanguineus]|uniref:Uncharacterized protein n=1 Tax=Rhipicephalus sanguineus TaxID=34632 RepID=A0A9D4T294_RHISA|nr:hypothetical protein HPB52_016280 [Rhipicephalus sanguineus]
MDCCDTEGKTNAWEACGIRSPVSNPSTEGPGAYKVDFYHDNQIQRWYDDSLRWCQDSSQLATEESAQRLVSQLDQVYYVDKHETIRIPGEVVFQDLHVQEAIRAQQASLESP